MLTINNIPVEDTFAEAFPMTAVRLIVTAETPGWAQTAGQVVTGYASSVIGCDVEAGVERTLNEDETIDGRPGVGPVSQVIPRSLPDPPQTPRG